MFKVTSSMRFYAHMQKRQTFSHACADSVIPGKKNRVLGTRLFPHLRGSWREERLELGANAIIIKTVV